MNVKTALGGMMGRLAPKLIKKFGILLVGCLSATSYAEDFERTFLVPMEENVVHSALKGIHSGVGKELKVRTAIVPSMTNTVIYYDHWEDGYETDLGNPVQSTTEIWGDNNVTNGVAPGLVTDLLDAGMIIAVEESIAIPRDPTRQYFDARDKFFATLPVSVSRLVNAKDPGEALAGGVNVYPIEDFGTTFVSPVGTNSAPGESLFQYCGMFIQAAFDGTVIEIDSNADGTVDITDFLNAGETYVVTDIKAGAKVTATKPFQAHLITGAVSSAYQMRWYTLFPQHRWDSDYLTPVGKTAGRDVRVWLYNPNSGNIVVHYETSSSSGNITVKANDFKTIDLPVDTAAHFWCKTGDLFIPVEAEDFGSSSYDWGHALIPTKILTEMTLVGYGPGSGGSTNKNGSPIWVTPVTNTTLYIDYDGDPKTGPNTDPSGNKYDFSTNVVALGSYKIFDNSDNDQTAMRIYSVDGTDLSSVWGNDPDAASAGSPYLDMGYALMPLPMLLPDKSAGLSYDADGDGGISPGDSLIYSVRVTRVGIDIVEDVILFDAGPDLATYVTNSVYINGTNILDDVSPPAGSSFPLDESGYNLGQIFVGETVTVTYVARIIDPFPDDEDGILNSVKANGSSITHFFPMPLGGSVSGQVRDDLDGDGDLADNEPGIAGATVSLYTDPNGDGDPSDGVLSDSMSSGFTGNYFFRHVATGTYVIVESDVVGQFSTGDADGGDFNRIAVTILEDSDIQDMDFLDAVSGLSITKVASPPGVWFPDAEITYTISMSNTGALPHTNLDLWDFMYSGQTYVSNSTMISVDGLFINILKDQFGTVSYNNNDGNEDFEEGWQETDGGGAGPSNGAIQVTGGQLRIQDGVAGVPAIYREANMTDHTYAGLMFNYYSSATTEGTDKIDLEISSDGVSWDVLDTYSGVVSGTAIHVISPYISTNTFVRFSVKNKYEQADEFFYVDNFQIIAHELSSYNTPGNPTNLLATGFTLPVGGLIEVTFTSTVSASFGVVTNSACVYTDIESNGLCAVHSKFVDTNAIPDRIGGQVRNDLDGDADINEDSDWGLQGVAIDVYNDPNADGDPSDGSLIKSTTTDRTGYYLVGALTNGYYVVVENDAPGFTSTGDSGGANDNWIPVHLPGGVDSLDNVFFDWSISGLLINKTAVGVEDTVDLGEVVTYSIMITNTRMGAVGGVKVVDLLPPEVAYMTNSVELTIRIPVDSNNVADTFPAVAYTNSTGSLDWLSDWKETGDGQGARNGDVVVISDASDYRLRIRDEDNAIHRVADLSGYTNAEVSLYYRRDGLNSGEYVALEASTNEYGTFTEVARFENDGSSSTVDASYNFTNVNISSYINSNTTIRFRTPSGGMSNGDQVFFDDVRISMIFGGVTVKPGVEPPNLLTNYIIRGYESVEVTFDVTVEDGDEVVNEATLTSWPDPGGMSSIITNIVAYMHATQGIHAIVIDPAYSNAIQLGWTATTTGEGEINRPYDLIYIDSWVGFSDQTSNSWLLAETRTNRFERDAGKSGSRAEPLTLGSVMRFYRTASKDKWRPERSVRVASPEIYVLKTTTLYEGQNWLSLPCLPDTNTIEHIFGKLLPAGSVPSDAARITWFDKSNEAMANKQIYLSTTGGGRWQYAFGGSGPADDMLLPFDQSFVFEIPEGEGNFVIPLVGKIPTNTLTQTLGDGFSIVNTHMPRRLRMNDLGLYESGFRDAVFPPAGGGNGDMAWGWHRASQRVYSGDLFWYSDGTLPSASPAGWYRTVWESNAWKPVATDQYIFAPDDGVLVYRPNSPGSMVLTNKLLYSPPTLYMTP